MVEIIKDTAEGVGGYMVVRHVAKKAVAKAVKPLNEAVQQANSRALSAESRALNAETRAMNAERLAQQAAPAAENTAAQVAEKTAVQTVEEPSLWARGVAWGKNLIGLGSKAAPEAVGAGETAAVATGEAAVATGEVAAVTTGEVVAGGALATAAAVDGEVAATNFWNPVGWVAAGALVVGGVAYGGYRVYKHFKGAGADPSVVHAAGPELPTNPAYEAWLKQQGASVKPFPGGSVGIDITAASTDIIKELQVPKDQIPQGNEHALLQMSREDYSAFLKTHGVVDNYVVPQNAGGAAPATHHSSGASHGNHAAAHHRTEVQLSADDMTWLKSQVDAKTGKTYLEEQGGNTTKALQAYMVDNNGVDGKSLYAEHPALKRNGQAFVATDDIDGNWGDRSTAAYARLKEKLAADAKAKAEADAKTQADADAKAKADADAAQKAQEAEAAKKVQGAAPNGADVPCPTKASNPAYNTLKTPVALLDLAGFAAGKDAKGHAVGPDGSKLDLKLNKEFARNLDDTLNGVNQDFTDKFAITDAKHAHGFFHKNHDGLEKSDPRSKGEGVEVTYTGDPKNLAAFKKELTETARKHGLRVTQSDSPGTQNQFLIEADKPSPEQEKEAKLAARANGIGGPGYIGDGLVVGVPIVWGRGFGIGFGPWGWGGGNKTVINNKTVIINNNGNGHPTAPVATPAHFVSQPSSHEDGQVVKSALHPVNHFNGANHPAHVAHAQPANRGSSFGMHGGGFGGHR